ncbi:SAM-dependent methyltransferase [Micromonospora sp. b486]|nr:SAM-dependent methyltransferase [Micromonospora sp. WMMB482]
MRRNGGDDPVGVRARLQPEQPNAASRFDYYLGGKDNFAADRAASSD